MVSENQPGNRLERTKSTANTCGRGMSLFSLTALSGILAPLIFTTVMAIVELIQPGYSPVHESISRLVLGTHGKFQTLSFFLFGFLFTVFSLRLYMATSRNRIASVGAGLFLVSGLSFFVLGIFPVDPHGETATTMTGIVHNGMAGLAAVFFMLGSVVFAIYFGVDDRWHNYRWFTVVVVFAFLGFSLIWKFAPDSWAWKGLAERIALLSGFLWIEVISIRLLLFCIGKRPASVK